MRAAIFIALYFKIGKPNSRHLETLSMAVHTSPALLKQRVGNAKTYIRPVQRDLDLTPVAKNNIDIVSLYVDLGNT